MKLFRQTFKLLAAAGLFGGLVVGSHASPVTFNVNLSAQTALGNFHSGAGDTVVLAGDWGGWAPVHTMSLTANTDVYTLTLDLFPATVPNYKFIIHNPASEFYIWETINNRTFEVPSGGINLPEVYFNDYAVVPEPATGVMLGAGMFAMLMFCRRGQRPTSDIVR